MTVRSINGDLEQLLDEVRDKRDRLQEHLTVYQSLRNQNTIRCWKMNEQHVILYGSKRTCGRIELKKIAMIKDRMEFKLQRKTSKVNFELEIKNKNYNWGRATYTGERKLQLSITGSETHSVDQNPERFTLLSENSSC